MRCQPYYSEFGSIFNNKLGKLEKTETCPLFKNTLHQTYCSFIVHSMTHTKFDESTLK